MCGRYTIAKPKRLEVTFSPDVVKAELGKPRYNIAPMQKAPVVALAEGKRVLADIQWGLTPSWANSPSEGRHIINARCETVAAKPAFRESFRTCRCLVPADGFYEWQKSGDGKRPFHIRLGDGEPFAFAGLYSRWTGKGEHAGEKLLSFAIITTQANEIMRPIHDRMPVILGHNHWEAWLDPSFADTVALSAMLAPFAGAGMNARPVSRLVNSPANDVPACMAPEE